jgi:hypothetical protein
MFGAQPNTTYVVRLIEGFGLNSADAQACQAVDRYIRTNAVGLGTTIVSKDIFPGTVAANVIIDTGALHAHPTFRGRTRFVL